MIIKICFVIFFKGMNGIVLNHVIISNGQEIPICHMNTIEFGVGNSKFVYVFQLKSIQIINKILLILT